MVEKGFQNASGLGQQGVLEGLNGLLNASHQIPKKSQKKIYNIPPKILVKNAQKFKKKPLKNL